MMIPFTVMGMPIKELFSSMILNFASRNTPHNKKNEKAKIANGVCNCKNPITVGATPNDTVSANESNCLPNSDWVLVYLAMRPSTISVTTANNNTIPAAVMLPMIARIIHNMPRKTFAKVTKSASFNNFLNANSSTILFLENWNSGEKNVTKMSNTVKTTAAVTRIRSILSNKIAMIATLCNNKVNLVKADCLKLMYLFFLRANNPLKINNTSLARKATNAQSGNIPVMNNAMADKEIKHLSPVEFNNESI